MISEWNRIRWHRRLE